MTLEDMLDIPLSQGRLRKEGSNEFGDLVRREVDEMTVVEEKQNIGLSGTRA